MSYIEIDGISVDGISVDGISGDLIDFESRGEEIINKKFLFTNLTNENYSLKINIGEKNNNHLTTSFLFASNSKVNNFIINEKTNLPFFNKENKTRQDENGIDLSIKFLKQIIEINIDQSNNINIFSIIKKYYD